MRLRDIARPLSAAPRDLYAWADRLTSALSNQLGAGEELLPAPILLAGRVPTEKESAVTPGVMLYDRQAGLPVIADGSKYIAVNNEPQLIAAVETAFNVGGTTFATGANRLVLNTTYLDEAPWGSVNNTNGVISLDAGTYRVKAKIPIRKNIGGITGTAAAYVALNSALTVSIGTHAVFGLVAIADATVDRAYMLDIDTRVVLSSDSDIAIVVNASTDTFSTSSSLNALGDVGRSMKGLVEIRRIS